MRRNSGPRRPSVPRRRRSSAGSVESAASAASNPQTRERRRLGGRSAGFMARQERLLAKQGRLNASSASRTEQALCDDDDAGDAPDDQSVATRRSTASRAPSLHPSVAVSEACSTATLGAGDATLYWDFRHRTVERNDLGHRCRECRKPFSALGEPLTERRGARVSMRYHAACFSGFADPRSQTRSSHNEGRLAGSQFAAAPSGQAKGKMRTSRHFDDNAGATKLGRGLGGLGSNGFGAKSSRREIAPAAAAAAPTTGGLSEAALKAHTAAAAAGGSGGEQLLRLPGAADVEGGLLPPLAESEPVAGGGE